MIFFAVFIAELVILFFLSRLVTTAISNILMRLTANQTTTINILSFVFLPGIIIHELSHMILASILFVRVGEIEFLPHISEDGLKLGSIAIGNTDPFRRVLIGFAPVLCGVGILFSVLSYIPIDLVVGKLLAFYIFFEIGNTMFSSKKDMQGTGELMIVLVVIFLALSVLGFRLPETFVQSLLSSQFVDFVKKADTLLLFPIGIDVVVYGATKILTNNW